MIPNPFTDPNLTIPEAENGLLDRFASKLIHSERDRILGIVRKTLAEERNLNGDRIYRTGWRHCAKTLIDKIGRE